MRSTGKKILIFSLLIMLAVGLLGCDNGVDVDTYTLTVEIEGEGTVVPGEGEHDKDADSVVDIAATPAAEWEFSHWVGEVAETNSAETAVVMDADQTVTAVFVSHDEFTVEFEDPNLEEAVREEINKPDGDLYLSDVIDIEEFEATGEGIASIEGIQYLKNLVSLDLGAYWDYDEWEWQENAISDISVLADLTKLENLNLSRNEVSDIGALGYLTNLNELNFASNQVADISALEGLTNLRSLSFADNQVANISVLKGLINLELLSFWDNPVDDIGILEGLINLRGLVFGGNQEVNDISVLEGLTKLKWLGFRGNQVADISALEGLTNLELLSFADNQVADISVLENLTNLEGLSFRYNQVDDITALVDNEGFGEGDDIDMRNNYLNLTEGSEDMENINKLIDRGVYVTYEPQKEEGETETLESHDSDEERRHHLDDEYFFKEDYMSKFFEK